LLKAFNDAQPEWGLTELAREVGLNKTTVYRLLSALESEGMITRNSATDAYRLGPEVIALGGIALRANDLRSIARAELEALVQQTRESVSLDVLAGSEMMVLDEVAGQYVLGTTQFVGSRWPLHATSTGKAMLAYLSDRERKALLRTPLARFTEKTIVDVDKLSRELDRIRKQGYVVTIGELEIGFAAVSAAIRNHDGYPVAAICVEGPSTRITSDRVDEVISLVKDAAERISMRLGFSEPA